MALTSHQRLLFDLVAEGLASGRVARDAVDRAVSAHDWYRRFSPDGVPHGMTRMLLAAAMRAPGADTGTTLAARAVEAAKLTTKHLNIAIEVAQPEEDE